MLKVSRGVCSRRAGMVLIAVAGVMSLGQGVSSANPTFILTPTGSISAEALAGFQAAANRWTANFTNNVTVRINIATSAGLPSGVIASTGSAQPLISYTSFKNALTAASSGSADDISAVASLPATSMSLYINYTTDNPNGANSPIPFVDTTGVNTTNIRIAQANMRALGLYSGSASDASLTFSSTFAFDYDPSNGISAGQLDFIGVVAHEIGHSLGFISGVDSLDQQSSGHSSDYFTSVSPMDVFRYSAASKALNSQDFSAGIAAKYFSLDKGVTSIAQFATGVALGDGRQASHWKDNSNLGIMDPTAANGELQTISENDRRLFDAIGWNRDNTWEWVNSAGTNFLNPLNWNADGITSAKQDGVFELGLTYTGNVTVSPISIAQFGGINQNANVRDLINRKDTFTLVASTITTSVNVARNFIVGDTAGTSASLTFTNGLLNTPTTMLGQSAAATGTFALTSGTWTNTGSVYVGGTATGPAGTGILNLNGGRANVQTSVVVYPTSTVTLSGSTLLTTPLLDVRGGQVSTTASRIAISNLSVSGGRVAISTGLSVASPVAAGGVGTINLSGTGTVAVTGSLAIQAGNVVTQTGGLLTSVNAAISGTYFLSGGSTSLADVTGPGDASVSAAGSLSATSLQLGGLSILGTGRVTLTGGSLAQPSLVSQVALATTGFLDVTNQALVFRNGDLGTVRGLAQNWWNNGIRNGTGLGSSSATAAGFTTIAVFPNVDSDGMTYYSNFGTLTLLTTDLIVRYDYVGDTNIDGVLDGIDAVNILEGMSTGATGWENGDINYDGAVNALDYNLFLAAFNANLPSLGSPSSFGDGSGAAVPEPSALAIPLLATLALTRRRR